MSTAELYAMAEGRADGAYGIYQPREDYTAAELDAYAMGQRQHRKASR